MESILTSIKKMLGIAEEYEHFDQDIIMHINSTLMGLTQMGVGPSNGFSIEDDTSLWTDFVKDTNKIQAVKSYIFLKVRLLFDPPTSSSVIESYNRMISEYEWRLNVAAESDENQMEDEQVDTALDKITELINHYMSGGENGDVQ